MTTNDVQLMIGLINTLEHFAVPRDRYAIQTPPTDECACLLYVNSGWITFAYEHGDMYGMQRHDDMLDAACRLIGMLGSDDAEIDAMLEYFDFAVN